MVFLFFYRNLDFISAFGIVEDISCRYITNNMATKEYFHERILIATAASGEC
jgi:hypothetical protein